MKTMSLMAALLLASAAPAAAQNLNPQIADYKAELFKDCYAGQDIGKLTRVSNPLLLLGSIAYIGPVMGPDGTVTTGWAREPMSLPISVAESVDPDNTTCSLEFEATAGGGLDVLGFGINAERSDVYKVNVRLISRQSLATVPEGTLQVPSWRAAVYKDQFRSVIGTAPPKVDQFFIFDNISIYLLQVERYRRTNAGITAGIGLFSGSAKYKKDETFKGTRLLVTGDPVLLTRATFGMPTVTVAVNSVVAPSPSARLVQTLSATELAGVEERLADMTSQ